MIRSLYLYACILLIWSVGAFASEHATGTNLNPPPHQSSFTPNLGQWDSPVLYRAETKGGIVWITNEGAVYQFRRYIEPENGNESLPADFFPEDEVDHGRFESMTVHSTLVGAATPSGTRDGAALGPRTNYFLGDDPEKWARNVQSVSSVRLRSVYDGIDVKYYFTDQGQVEYDFIVEPGADPTQIEIALEGIESLEVNDLGDLIIYAPWSTIQQQCPRIYQERDGWRDEVKGSFQLLSGNRFTISLTENYDRSRELIVDPVIDFSTFYGSAGYEISLHIGRDDSGYVYIGGYSPDATYPLVDEMMVFQGEYDVFVTKFSPNCDSVIFSTYLGSAEQELIGALAVAPDGTVTLSGTVWGSNYPTVNEYFTDLPDLDIFVTVLNPAGDSIRFSTYWGGSGPDANDCLTIDADGNIYFAGESKSSDYPLVNEVQGYVADWDLCISKISPYGDSVFYSTLIGGHYREDALSIVVDDSGQAYFTGFATLWQYPTTEGAFIEDPQGDWDGILTKLSADGDSLIYSSLIGGMGFEMGYGVAVDSNGCAFVTGITNSDNFPIANAIQPVPGYGAYDGYIVKLNPAGSALEFGTFLGGSGWDNPNFLATDDQGFLYMSGETYSADYPTVNSPNQHVDERDFIVAKMAGDGSYYAYNAIFGGSGDDVCHAMVVCPDYGVLMGGSTSSPDFPIVGGVQPVFGGDRDPVIIKVSSSCIDSDLDGLGDPGNPGNTCFDDNCPTVFNPSQHDTDNDGIGDACDDCTDLDGDGYGNPGFAANTCPEDNCPNSANADQLDTDNDGYGDVCDECTDSDNDGYGDPGFPDDTCVVDNCPEIANPDQLDMDFDLIGDACDPICCRLIADINYDATGPDIADLVFLVSYMFQSGPEPPCMGQTDIDGNGSLVPDIADLVYLVSYMFSGGPPPVPCAE